MRGLVSVVLLTMACGSAFAAPRREEYTAPGRANATSMSCQAAKQFVASHGAAILATSRTTYDRYVRDLSFCYSTQETQPAFTPTRDNPACFVGYTCKEVEPPDDF